MSEIQSCFKRYETKYLLTHEQYTAVLEGMASYMKPDAHPRYSLSNVYYDTERFDLIRASLEKPIYKEKLRMRSYGVPGSRDKVFVEIKKKYDGVVYKRRVTMELQEALRYLCGASRGDGSQISREIDWFLHVWNPKPAAYIGYDREAWAGIRDKELRITFDTNLRGRDWALDLRDGDFGELLLPPDRILMELKFTDAAPLWLSRLLSENGIFPVSFSKYGTYYKHLMGREPTYGN